MQNDVTTENPHEVTRAKLDEIHRLSAELDLARDEASELLRTAQDRHNSDEHELTHHGETKTLSEKLMWEEVFQLGKDCESAAKLKELHPEVFAAYDSSDALAAELKRYAASELGVAPERMTLSAQLRLTEGIVRVLLEETGKGWRKMAR